MNDLTHSEPEIVHVFANYPHHVVNMVSFLCRLRSNSNKVLFYIKINSEEDKQKYAFVSPAQAVFYRDFSGALADIKRRQKCPIIFHSLFDYECWISLLCSGLYRRSVWICWGADLYKHILPAQPGTSLKNRTKVFVELWIKRILLNRFLIAATLTRGEADLIRKKLWVRDAGVRVLRYPVFGIGACAPDELTDASKDRSPIKIICGNSADPSNNHLDMLDSLKQFKDKDIQILMPLSYGADKVYTDKVSQNGKAIFGGKFTPLTEFMKKEEYDRMLSDVDIGVFFHQRQQGLYVACSLILKGKLVYLRGDVSSYDDFSHNGVRVGDSNNISTMCFEDFIDMPHSTAVQNVEIAERMLAEEYVAEDWNAFYLDLVESVKT